MTTVQHPIDYALELIGTTHRNYRAVPTADEHTLRSILADLETGGDTPVFDQLADPMPEALADRVLAALKKETRR